jgi:hypothetical protein
MTRASIVAGAVWAAAAFGTAWAAPVDDLKAQGFVVVKETKVRGDFDGCDYGRKVSLVSGGVFTCSGFGYMHASSPKAVLLKSKDGRQFKLVIHETVFDGAFS